MRKRLNLITDISGLKVGSAHDEKARTGVSVILPQVSAICAYASVGGGPGTRETDALRPENLVDRVDAVVLSGGSVYGLAAADGVAAQMGAEGKGFGLIDQPGIPKSPVIPSAILYDLANQGDKNWHDTPPYNALGRKAYQACAYDFQIGNAGAGYGALAGEIKGGLGSASYLSSEGYGVGALVAVNSFGSVLMPGTNAFWAAPYEVNGEFGGVRPPADYSLEPENWGRAKINPQPGQNTTIACLATDIALTPAQAKRIAIMALSGFSRAIRPVFTPFDGDSLFILSVGDKVLAEPHALSLAMLGELAANTLARAIARGVYAAKSLPPYLAYCN